MGLIIGATMVAVHTDPDSQTGTWTQDIRISLLPFCRDILLTRKENSEPCTVRLISKGLGFFSDMGITKPRTGN
jgi:hypothetical protein